MRTSPVCSRKRRQQIEWHKSMLIKANYDMEQKSVYKSAALKS
jgi:CRISPR/Cas system-associated protein endoribonuclease Cas2